MLALGDQPLPIKNKTKQLLTVLLMAVLSTTATAEPVSYYCDHCKRYSHGERSCRKSEQPI